MAYGMTTIIQWLFLLFQTVLNTYMIHPEFGIGVTPGASIADIDLQQLYAQINQQIVNDPRFAGVTNLQLQASPPYLGITLGVQVAGTTGIFPVTFNLAA